MRKRSGPGARAIAQPARKRVLCGTPSTTSPAYTAQVPPLSPPTSWRDVLDVHEAAELFPLMAADELAAVGEDIKKNGLRVPIVLNRWGPSERWRSLVDGRNRLDAMELVGLEVVRDGKLNRELVKTAILEGDPYEYVISANIHRRHLTAEQKRDLIAQLIQQQPEKSNRQIAATVKVSHPTVAKVRGALEKKGDVGKVTTSIDTRGRRQPTKKGTASKTSTKTRRRTPEEFQRDIAAKKTDVAPATPNEVVRDPVAPDEELKLLREFARWFVSERVRIAYDLKDRDEWRMLFDRVKAVLGAAP